MFSDDQKDLNKVLFVSGALAGIVALAAIAVLKFIAKRA